MKLETKRLILRPPRKDDWKDLVETTNDVEIYMNIPHLGYPFRKKEALKFIDEKLKKWKEKNKTEYNFLIELKDQKKVIGVVRIYSISKFYGDGTTGSWINKDYRGKGYITEAKIEVNDFAFNKLRLRRLASYVYTKNKASQVVQEKVGYKLEGVKRKSFKYKSGKTTDALMYGLLKEEWERRRGKLIKELDDKIKKMEK